MGAEDAGKKAFKASKKWTAQRSVPLARATHTTESKQSHLRWRERLDTRGCPSAIGNRRH